MSWDRVVSVEEWGVPFSKENSKREKKKKKQLPIFSHFFMLEQSHA
jgi:hypothetical protein